jgi:hypothetical protein
MAHYYDFLPRVAQQIFSSIVTSVRKVHTPTLRTRVISDDTSVVTLVARFQNVTACPVCNLYFWNFFS